MTRRVLILAHSFPPLASVGGMRAARFVKYLPEAGWQPVVVAPGVDAVPGRPVDASLAQILPPDVHVVRTKTWGAAAGIRKLFARWPGQSGDFPVPPSAGAGASDSSDEPTGTSGEENSRRARHGRRPLRSLVAAAKLPFSIPDPYVWWIGPAFRAALAVIRTVKPDVILSTSPPHSVHLVGLALKAWTSLPWVIDLRDPWARNPWQASHDWKLRQSLHRVFERLCVRRADLVILNTPELAEDFERTYARAWRTRFSVLPNGYDPDLLPHVQRLIAQAPRDPHVLRIGHVGAVYGRRDLAPLVLAMEKLLAAGRRVRLDLVGPIDQSQEIEALVRARGLAEHVKLWGRVRYDEALLHTAQSDVLLVIRNNTPLQAPAKLYEILMFRRPIVALDDGGGAAARLVRQFSLGAVADPTDAASIAAAVEAAVAAAGNGRAAQGRENALAEFDGRKQVARLATLLDQAARNSPSRR